jgi:hypothetical protein
VNYSAPYGFTTMVDGQGATNHHSIVNENSANYFYNKNYGFCAYAGGSQIVPISRDIENWVRDIKLSSTPTIVGAALPYKNSIMWTVPLEGAGSPNALLIYDYVENKWTRRDITAHYIAPIVRATDVTWTNLSTEFGYTTWTSFGSLRWADLISETPTIALSATDGELYTLSTESDDGSDYDGYRVEPALAFGGPNTHSTLFEIWFSIVSGGAFSLYVQYRSGNTEAELRSANWTALDEISLDKPENAVCYINGETQKSNRLHQIKWGTDSENEQFIINQIEFVYETEGRY